MNERLGKVEIAFDPVADMIDDIAALGSHWEKNRGKGRMPSAIRQAIILAARDLLWQVDMQDIKLREGA